MLFECFRLSVLFRNILFHLLAATATVEGKMSKTLKKMLKKVISDETKEQLLVADAKLGQSIKVSNEKSSINPRFPFFRAV